VLLSRCFTHTEVMRKVRLEVTLKNAEVRKPRKAIASRRTSAAAISSSRERPRGKKPPYDEARKLIAGFVDCFSDYFRLCVNP
jgi:hypothetical protein